MSAARITGNVSCEELSGPLCVTAHAERESGGSAVALTDLADGQDAFALDVPPGTWWVQATLEQHDVPGARALSAWCRDAVTVAAGEEVGGVRIVLEVPEQVR
jgi:hypothetical protein